MSVRRKGSLVASVTVKRHLTLLFVAHNAVGTTKATVVVPTVKRLVARLERLVWIATMRGLVHVRWRRTRHGMSVIHARRRPEHLVFLLKGKGSHQRTMTASSTAASSTCTTKAFLSMNLPRRDLSQGWWLTHFGTIHIHWSDRAARR